MAEQSTFIEIHSSRAKTLSPSVYQCLREGKILVVRDVPEIYALRETLLKNVATARYGSPSFRDELLDLFLHRRFPSAEAIYALTTSMSEIRKTKYISALFADFIVSCQFPSPILAEDGRYRMVFSRELQAKLHARTDLFLEEDFFDERADGAAIFFLPWPVPPHRDINRPHYTFMANYWFPLHDAGEDEVLIFFPDCMYKPFPSPFPSPIRYPEHPHMNNPDPNTWGFGVPVRIPLKFGDMYIFHSEHCHGSSIPPLDLPRISYDFRIAAGCYDNHRVYLDCFWNLNNFIPEKTMTSRTSNAIKQAAQLFEQRSTCPRSILEHHQSSSGGESIAHQYFYWATQGDVKESHNLLKDAARVFDDFPFADDRYIELIKNIYMRDKGLAEQLARKVAAETTSYFWALEIGNIAISLLDERELAEMAFAKARQLAETTSISFAANPIAYDISKVGECPQVLPSHVDEIIHQLRKLNPSPEKAFKSIGEMSVVRNSDKPVLMEEGLHGYNIVKLKDVFYGISQSEGIFDIAMLEKHARFPWISDRRLLNVIAWIEGLQIENPGNTPCLMDEGYKGYNIVKYLDVFYGVHQQEGSIEIKKIKTKAKFPMFSEKSLQNVRARIDALSKEGIVEQTPGLYQRITQFFKKYVGR